MDEEDRLSNLPDNVIHRILSFLDTKYAIRTSTLSRKWKPIWTSMPYLNLNSLAYDSLPQFAQFVRHMLSHRNNGAPVCEVTLVFTGLITQLLVNNIVNYAYLHNVEKLVMNWSTWKYLELPQFLLNSSTLKHLSLTDHSYYTVISNVNSAWDFPVLESLNLSNMRFGDGREKSLDLFSKCVNLKDLTLHRAYMFDLDVFNVCAPQLLNLTITNPVTFPKVFNVVAPNLKNLTASIKESGVEVPRLLHLWTEGLDCLEKVNLSLSNPSNGKHIYVPVLLDLFQKLRSTKFLTFSEEIIEILSSYVEHLSREPCPFNNLKYVKIDKVSLHRRDRIAQVRKYFLDNSPTATFIMDLPKVPPTRVKRPMQPVHNNTMANKVSKLDVPTAKLSSDPKPSSSNQDEVIAKQKEMFEAKIQMQDEVNEKQQAMFDLKVRMQDDVIAKQKTMFVAQIQMQDKVIAEQKAMFEARIEIQDNVIVEQKEKLQIQEEVIAKQKAMFEVKTQMVEAAKLQHEKLISLIIKSKIAELKVKLERGNPDHEVVRSTGIDIKSVMDLIPETLRVNLEARFSSMYEGFKSLFLTHVDDSQWEKIEFELKKECMGFLE